MAELNEYIDFTKRAAKHYGVDEDLALALIEHESKWDPKATSPKGAMGLGQLMPGTAKDLGVQDAYNPWENLDASIRYLRDQLKTFKGDHIQALAAYNAGPGAVQAHGGVPPYEETQNYVKGITARREEIKVHRAQKAGLQAMDERAEWPEEFPRGNVQDVVGAVSDAVTKQRQQQVQMYKGGAEVPGVDQAMSPIEGIEVTPFGAIPKMAAESFLQGSASQLRGIGTDLWKAGQSMYKPANPLVADMEKRWGLAPPATPEEMPTYKLGSALAGMAEKIPITPKERESLTGQVAGGAGGLASLLWPMLVPGVRRLGFNVEMALPQEARSAYIAAQEAMRAAKTPAEAAAALDAIPAATRQTIATAQKWLDVGKIGAIAGVGGTGSAYEAARQWEEGPDPLEMVRKTASPQQAADIALLQGSVDALAMGIPVSRGFKALNAALGGNAATILRQMATGAVEFPTFMAGLQTLQNGIVKLTYDQQRELLDGVVEGTPANMIIGALLGGGGATIGRIKNLRDTNQIRKLYDEIQSLTPTEEKIISEVVAPEEPTPALETPKKPLKTEYKTERGAANAVESYRKRYGLEYTYGQDPETGLYKLVERAKEETPAGETPVVEDPHEETSLENASEVPEDVPLLTPEMIAALTAAREGKREPPEGLPLDEKDKAYLAAGRAAAEKWRAEQAKKKAAEVPPPPAEEAPPTDTSGKPVAIATEAEQMAIDDSVVDAYEETKSFVQAAKEVGLSIAETKARYKYATGKSEKRPYEVAEAEVGERKPVETLSSRERYTDISDLRQRIPISIQELSHTRIQDSLNRGDLPRKLVVYRGQELSTDVYGRKGVSFWATEPEYVNRQFLLGEEAGIPEYEQGMKIGRAIIDTTNFFNPKSPTDVRRLLDAIQKLLPAKDFDAKIFGKWIKQGAWLAIEDANQDFGSDNLLKSLGYRGAFIVESVGGRPYTNIMSFYPEDITAGLGRESKNKVKSTKIVEQGTQTRKGPLKAPFFNSIGDAYRWRIENNMEGEVEPLPGTTKFQIRNARPAGESLFTFSPFGIETKWYSKLKEAVATDYANWPKRLSGTDALKKLEKLVGSGKAKKEELDDMLRLTGLKQRLEGMEGAKRDDILAEIMDSGIEVEEIWRSSVRSPEYLKIETQIEQLDMERQSLISNLDQIIRNKRTGYAQKYVLSPEDLLALYEYDPTTSRVFSDAESTVRRIRTIDKLKEPLVKQLIELSSTNPKYENTGNYNLGGPREGYFELVLTSPQASEMSRDSAHFIEGQGKRQIGWVRGNWRKDSEGRKILFIEEVQSKRHQEGREKGYRPDLTELPEGSVVRQNAESGNWVVDLPTETAFVFGHPTRESAINRALEILNKREIPGTPDAPFRQSWLRVIARRLLRYAAENNADAVAWTTGEQQAERWSLRQVADELSYDKETQHLTGHKGLTGSWGRTIPENELSVYVGKDLADQLLRQNNERVVVPEGVDFYSSKWPEKIYGFQRGGYEKSLLATAMKEAMGQFRGKVEEVKGKEPGRFEVEPGVQDTELEKTIFSRQPAVFLTPEAKEHWSKNPMLLYTGSPFAFNKRNLAETKEVLFKGLSKEGEGKLLDEITRKYPDQDLSKIGRVIGLVQWHAKKFPELKPFLEAVMSRSEQAQKSLHKYLEWAPDYTDLEPKDRRTLTDFFVGMDGTSYQEMGFKGTVDPTTGKFKPDNPPFKKTAKGNILLNPEYLKEWREIVKQQHLSPELTEIALRMRQALDTALVDKWNLARGFVKKGSRGLKAMRNEVFGIPNYFPHVRSGEWVLQAHAIDPETGELALDAQGKPKLIVSYATDLHPGLFDTQKILAKEGEPAPPHVEKYIRNKLLPRLEADPVAQQLMPQLRWSVKRHSANVVQMFGNQAVMTMALQDLINRAAKEYPGGFAEKYAASLNSAFSEVLKKSGEWGHFAHRSGIHGYDTDDAGQVFYKYLQGFSSILAKSQMVRDLGQMSRNINTEQVELTHMAKNFFDQVLDPNRDITKSMHAIRELAFLNYINPARFFLVNMTNAITHGSPVLATHIGPVADKYLMKAISKATSYMAGKGTKLDADLLQAVKESYEEGSLRAQFLESIDKDLAAEKSTLPRPLSKAKAILGWPAKTSEIASRVATFTAAFEAYRDGRIRNKATIEEYGGGNEKITGSMTPEQFQNAKRFAEWVVHDSHSIYGEFNKPEIVRGSALGRLAGSALIFRHFTWHTMQMWNAMRRQGGQDGYYALGRSLMASTLLGGLPLAATFKALYEKFAEEDPYAKLKDATDGAMGDWFVYGVPAALGLNIHNSFDIDPPTSMEEILGVPWSMGKQLMNAKKAIGVKDYRRALEYAMPVKLMRDILVAQRQYSKGVTTLSGQPVNEFNKSEPYKTSLSESARQVAGFPSLNLMKMRDIQESVSSLEDIRRSKESTLATRYINAMRSGDQAEMAAIINEANEWNTDHIKKGRPHLTLKLKDAIKSRMRPAMQPSKKMRGKAMEMMETWRE